MNPGGSSVLAAAGPQAARIIGLWCLFLAVCAVVHAAVLAAMIAEPSRPEDRGPVERRRRLVVRVALSLAVLVLLSLLVRTAFAD